MRCCLFYDKKREIVVRYFGNKSLEKANRDDLEYLCSFKGFDVSFIEDARFEKAKVVGSKTMTDYLDILKREEKYENFDASKSVDERDEVAYLNEMLDSKEIKQESTTDAFEQYLKLYKDGLVDEQSFNIFKKSSFHQDVYEGLFDSYSNSTNFSSEECAIKSAENLDEAVEEMWSGFDGFVEN